MYGSTKNERIKREHNVACWEAGQMLAVMNLFKQFDGLKAVNDVSIHIEKGTTYGLVGELWIWKKHDWQYDYWITKSYKWVIQLEGLDLWDSKNKFIRPKPGKMQIVFQDPQSSLDSRLRSVI